MTSPSSPSPGTPDAGKHASTGGESRTAVIEYWPGLLVTALSLLILVLAFLILRELGSILRPLLIAAFLCYLIVPAHHWLVRHRVPSMLAYILIVGGVLTVSYGLGGLLLSNLSRIAADLPNYAQTLETVASDAARDLKERLSHFIPDERDDDASPKGEAIDERGHGGTVPATAPAEAVTATRPASQAPEDTGFQLISTERLIALGRSAVEVSLGLVTMAIVVLFYLIFLLAEEAGFERRVAAAFGSERAGRIMGIIAKINTAVAQYIAVKTLVSLLVGGITTAILLLFGVQYAVMWGILTFFANFIPYIGSLVAVILPILMSLIQFGTLGKPLLLLALLSVVQQVIGSIVEPRMVGQRLGLSPLVVLLSLAFWWSLWGITGMILAAPLMVTLKIVLESMEQTRPIAKMMSDR